MNCSWNAQVKVMLLAHQCRRVIFELMEVLKTVHFITLGRVLQGVFF